MKQKNHHFLFPQTHFGSIEDFDEELLDEEGEIEDQMNDVPWVLVLEPDKLNQSESNIGLYINWTNDLEL